MRPFFWDFQDVFYREICQLSRLQWRNSPLWKLKTTIYMKWWKRLYFLRPQERTVRNMYKSITCLVFSAQKVPIHWNNLRVSKWMNKWDSSKSISPFISDGGKFLYSDQNSRPMNIPVNLGSENTNLDTEISLKNIDSKPQNWTELRSNDGMHN